MAWFRSSIRLAGLLGLCFWAALEFAATQLRHRQSLGPAHRAAWLQTTSQRILNWLGIQVSVEGTAPQTPLLVVNHVSYLDILVLAARGPSTFVAKSDVARWPLFGKLATHAGTIFINRQQRSDVLRVTTEMARAAHQGMTVVLFPEGTSSDGRQVLPFRPSLLEPAAQDAWPVGTAALLYQSSPLPASEAVAYCGEATFLPHLWRLLGLLEVKATVRFAAEPISGSERKTLARQLHARVSELRAWRGPPATPAPTAPSP